MRVWQRKKDGENKKYIENEKERQKNILNSLERLKGIYIWM